MPVAAPYATPSNVQAELGANAYLALVDRDGDGDPDTSEVEAALLRASSLADVYLSRHLPLDEAPTWLVGAVVDIAIYRLSGANVAEAERQRYEDAIKTLEAVQRGKGGVGFGPSDAMLDDDIEIDAPEHVMTREHTRGAM